LKPNERSSPWRRDKKNTISPFHEGKMVFLHLLSAENALFICHSVLQTKLYFCCVMETKLTLMVCAAQNRTFTVCHGQISQKNNYKSYADSKRTLITNNSTMGLITNNHTMNLITISSRFVQSFLHFSE